MRFSEDMGLMLGYTFPGLSELITTIIVFQPQQNRVQSRLLKSHPSTSYHFPPLTSTSNPRARQHESDQASLHQSTSVARLRAVRIEIRYRTPSKPGVKAVGFNSIFVCLFLRGLGLGLDVCTNIYV